MKSKLEQRQQRGWITKADLQPCKNLTDPQLLALLKSENPCERTIGAILLAALTPEAAKTLLQVLSKEKALYTRLAICERLQKGNAATAALMLPYLGTIGHNQYRNLPEAPSKKKSYPLPRDIIARTLGKMPPETSKILFAKAASMEVFQLSELLDALGYMTFYHSELATAANLQKLLAILREHEDNDLIVWKILTCLSAFPLDDSREKLTEYADCQGILALEAQRSLTVMENQTK